MLARLLEHPSAKTFSITAITRSPPRAKILQDKFGIKAVVGSTNDEELVAKLASEAHYVFSMVRLSFVCFDPLY